MTLGAINQAPETDAELRDRALRVQLSARAGEARAAVDLADYARGRAALALLSGEGDEEDVVRAERALDAARRDLARIEAARVALA